MKKFTFILGLLFLASSLNAQVLFQSSFEDWTGALPDGWAGSTTNIGPTNYVKYTTSAQSGTSACQLINTTTSHKRFSSQNLAIVEGQSYKINFWVRGQGEIRTGLNNGFIGGSGYQYGTYITVNSTTWTEHEQTLTSDTTASDAQFIFSLRSTNATNDHLQIDNVTISLTTAAEIDTLSIYDIQYTTAPTGDSPVKDQIVYTSGVVTAHNTTGFFIQDGEGPWNGLYIFNNTFTVSPGDSILIKGNITEYNNMTEMTQVSKLEILGQTSIPAPSIITTAQINSEEYESVLVKVLNAKCTNASAAFGMWDINDNSGVAKVDKFFYTYTPTLNVHYNITGPTMYSFDEFRIEPRDAADVEIFTSVETPQTSVAEIYPNPASEMVSVVLNTKNNITVTNILGQTVYTSVAPSSTHSINVSTWQKGMYLVNMASESGTKSVYKLIIN